MTSKNSTYCLRLIPLWAGVLGLAMGMPFMEWGGNRLIMDLAR
jgi:hypothetical protein